jgi:hypothetical protein
MNLLAWLLLGELGLGLVAVALGSLIAQRRRSQRLLGALNRLLDDWARSETRRAQELRQALAAQLALNEADAENLSVDLLAGEREFLRELVQALATGDPAKLADLHQPLATFTENQVTYLMQARAEALPPGLSSLGEAGLGVAEAWPEPWPETEPEPQPTPSAPLTLGLGLDEEPALEEETAALAETGADPEPASSAMLGFDLDDEPALDQETEITGATDSDSLLPDALPDALLFGNEAELSGDMALPEELEATPEPQLTESEALFAELFPDEVAAQPAQVEAFPEQPEDLPEPGITDGEALFAELFPDEVAAQPAQVEAFPEQPEDLPEPGITDGEALFAELFPDEAAAQPAQVEAFPEQPEDLPEPSITDGEALFAELFPDEAAAQPAQVEAFPEEPQSEAPLDGNPDQESSAPPPESASKTSAKSKRKTRNQAT